jgi:cell division protein FtsQ
MSSKKFSVKKLLLTVLWTVISTATIVLLVAAARNKNGKRCRDVVINIKGVDGTEYVSKKQILNTISGGRPDLMQGAPIKTFDLQQLEELLERNLWIRNAELFFDNNDVLHADITEREPVARVFRVNGESFYIDDMGEQLPITNDQVARVPVFTSFPTETTAAKKKDSLLQEQVKEMGNFILKNDFWMAQVEQVNISNYEFELVPKLGNHLIQFGNTEKMEQKFNRLLLFYKSIMNKTGWNYYSALDVRYNKQLVAVRRDSVSLFKSFVVEQNNYKVNTAIDSSYLNNDTTIKTEKPLINQDPNSLLTSGAYMREPTSAEPVLKSATVKPETNENRNAMKNQLPTPKVKTIVQNPKPTEQKPKPKTVEESVLNEAKSQPVKKQPKAVMKKKENE